MDCRAHQERRSRSEKGKSGSNSGALPTNPPIGEGSGKSVHAGIEE